MSPSVFGIGWAKSGTHSLCDACAMLGLRSLHFGDDHYTDKNPRRQRWLQNASDGLPLCDGLEEFDVVADYPVCRDWRTLALRRPEARFVLTYRSPHDCALSWMRQRLRESSKADLDWPVRYEEVVKEIETHVSDVCEFFCRCPERLLILDMRESDDIKWRLLADFVRRDRPVEGTPFPRSYWHVDMQALP